MPVISETNVAVRFFGDDLDPDALSARLGAQAQSCARKGEVIRSERTGRERTARTGRWIFKVERREPGDLDGQIRELFGSLTSDLNIWHELAAKYHPDLFVGLFLKETNEGLDVSADCLALLGARGVKLSLDIYGPLDQPTMPNFVRLHRVLAAKPEKVYRAFIEADALAKWLPPNGFSCTVHHLDANVGGTFRMSFRNFTTGMSHSFGGEYLELKPGKRVRYTDKFDDPNLPGEMQVTVTLKPVTVGTEVYIVQEGIPDAIPAEACYLGWQDSLRNLASLVEPEINQ